MKTTNPTPTVQAQPENAPITIGSHVRCNKGFAWAFEGQPGTITSERTDVFGKQLFTITFDTPTPPATNWTPCETLAAEASCYDLIESESANPLDGENSGFPADATDY